MRKVVEVYKFPRMEVLELNAKAIRIYKAVSTHTEVFPAPIPSMPDLLVAITSFGKAVTASNTGDRMKLAICRDEKRKLAGMLQQLGGYVNVVANSNKLIGSYSGFDLIGEHKTPPRVDYVEPPVLSGNSSGRMTAVSSVVPGAIIYRHCITTNRSLPINQWKAVEVKRVRYEFMDLQPGLQYYVITGACDKDGNWVYSQPSSRYSL